MLQHDGNIPVLYVHADTIPQAWEIAVLEVWDEGIDIKTEYDKPEDPPSKDATVMILVDHPLAEPRIHKNFPGGPEELESYRQEVVNGIHDHWINPEENKWSYTYHERLFAYSPCEDLSRSDSPRPFVPIDQIQYVIDYLAKTHYTRRAQAITWQPTCDPKTYDPPCFCAGTKILTPSGGKDIETIKNGDEVYSYDAEKNILIVDKVKNYFKTRKESISIDFYAKCLQVSTEQLIFTDKGWKKAQDLTINDYVKISTICSGGDVTDMMMIGYLHGNGWLSVSINKRNNKLKFLLSFSIHYQSDPTWLMEYLNNKSSISVQIEEQNIKSKLVPGGGISKKISIDDKKMWQFFSRKCPIGHKTNKSIKINVDELSQQECKDFLTGIYSAEGCVYFTRGKSSTSIQISMNWPACIDLISKILNRLGIKHRRYVNNRTHRIYINKNSEIIKAVNIFDFRLDSRKQAKWQKLKSSIYFSELIYTERWANIQRIKKDYYLNHKTQKELKAQKGFNSRILKDDYSPTFRLYILDCPTFNNYIMLPVYDSTEMGKKDVYDFEVSHKDHSIIANNVIAHNCLQRIWCRILKSNEGKLTLNMNTHWRSRDLYKAWFMNVYALTDLQRFIAIQVSKKIGEIVDVGRYVDISDSLHLYGSYYEEFEPEIKKMRKEDISTRVWSSDHPAFSVMTKEAREHLKEDPDFYSKGQN